MLSSKLAKSKVTGSPAYNNTKSLDAERKRINLALTQLDNAEITALENRSSDLNLESFIVLKEAFENIVLSPPPKKSQQLYSAHFVTFI